MAGKDEARARRLAEALRENLRRRKAQARRLTPSPSGSAGDPEAGVEKREDEEPGPGRGSI